MYYADKLTKQFHSCNAHTEHYKDMEMFVSYKTPIAILSYDTPHIVHTWMFHQLSIVLQLPERSLAVGFVSMALITMM